nr:uncharacterized protein LOC109184064 [Ipomoea trifida]
MVTLVFLNNFPMNLGSWNLGRGASNSENKNPNSLKLVPEISGQDEISRSKAELCFGSITRNSRLMKRLRPLRTKLTIAEEVKTIWAKSDCSLGFTTCIEMESTQSPNIL